MLRRLLVANVCLGCCLSAFAQQPDPTEEKVSILLEDRLSSDETRQLDFETLVDLEQGLRRRPINLNRADEDDLQLLVSLQLLTPAQATSLLEYRRQLGTFTSIYELQAVPYLDIPSIRQILPYVFVSDDLSQSQITARELLTQGQSMLLVRSSYVMQPELGYRRSAEDSASHYLGSPYSLYARYRYSYGTKFSWGITGQKDAGEEFFRGSQQQGFDFYSAHAFYRGRGIVRSAAIGDYAVNLGQGLVMGAGFGVAKSSYVTSVKNSGRILWPYTSADEYRFLRGAAATAGWRSWQLTAFASSRRTDGNVIVTDTLDENRIVTSIGGDGLHRTPSELADRNAVGFQCGGLHLQYGVPTFSVGAAVVHNRFSVPLSPTYAPYNTFYFRGTDLTQATLHFDWSYKNFNWFGEWAYSSPSATAWLSGVLASLHPRVDAVLLLRSYSRDFTTFFPTAFSENTTPKNEQGVYSGLVFRLSSTLSLSAYCDLYQHPWLQFRADAPSQGQDYLLQLTFKPSKRMEAYVRWRNETELSNADVADMPHDVLTEAQRHSLRLHLSYAITASVTLRSRLEAVRYRHLPQGPHRGWLIYQDVIWKQLGSPLQLTGRFALFDADDYDARIYAYENDVLYVYSVPAFYNRGIRSYLLARYSFSRALDLWLRLAATYYSNLKTIGSGLSEIDGPVKSEIKAELRVRF
ncbi:MAG: helix-hairpin-helix domain-containing protein [Chitinophagales bacterium]|nr:helix-hairpin-helix domain-containing protein [Chitinophagales bacterium]MDW8394046.1 helix-hairpin-helix domain-containing protein [Chitinophagales bacterium]